MFVPRLAHTLTLALSTALSSARAPWLESLTVHDPEFSNGAGAQFATAIRAHVGHSLTELHGLEWQR
jgi:hypothetical protein